jgi:hypothetical protein
VPVSWRLMKDFSADDGNSLRLDSEETRHCLVAPEAPKSIGLKKVVNCDFERKRHEYSFANSGYS